MRVEFGFGGDLVERRHNDGVRRSCVVDNRGVADGGGKESPGSIACGMSMTVTILFP